MRQPMGKALWSDCETDEERAEFFRAGRAWEIGVSGSMAIDVANAFEDAAKWRQRVNDSAVRLNPQTHQFSIQNIALTRDENVAAYLRQSAKPAPPWGPDAVPLMVCPKAGIKRDCATCRHSEQHPGLGGCAGSIFQTAHNCPPCVQVGWRERSKL